MMQIIPVIDLLNGQVVHAKKGERQHYQPIASLLASSSDPLDIVAALLAVYPFTQLYIADLNAIQKTEGGCRSNYTVIEAIKQHYPTLTLWVDAGISCNTELNMWKNLNARLIIASENLSSIENYSALTLQDSEFILSLDFFHQGYKGPVELRNHSHHWPQDVIVMTLANVGLNQGANTELLTEIIAQAKDTHIIAAGGIRNLEDLIRLKNMGVHSALVATAIHQKQISTEQLEHLNQ